MNKSIIFLLLFVCAVTSVSAVMVSDYTTDAKILTFDSGVKVYMNYTGLKNYSWDTANGEINLSLIGTNLSVWNETGKVTIFTHNQTWGAILSSGSYEVSNEDTCLYMAENFTVNRSTTVCRKFYNLKDTDGSGVFNLTTSYVDLDFNGATINGTGSPFKFNSKQGVNIYNATILGYMAATINLTDNKVINSVINVSGNITINGNVSLFKTNITFTTNNDNTDKFIFARFKSSNFIMNLSRIQSNNSALGINYSTFATSSNTTIINSYLADAHRNSYSTYPSDMFKQGNFYAFNSTFSNLRALDINGYDDLFTWKYEIINNSFINCQDAILISRISKSTSTILIANNTITSDTTRFSYARGIYLSNVNYTIIRNNNISLNTPKNYSYSIDFVCTQRCENNIVERNYIILDLNHSGIVAGNYLNNLTIINNTIIGSVQQVGISLQYTNNSKVSFNYVKSLELSTDSCFKNSFSNQNNEYSFNIGIDCYNGIRDASFGENNTYINNFFSLNNKRTAFIYNKNFSTFQNNSLQYLIIQLNTTNLTVVDYQDYDLNLSYINSFAKFRNTKYTNYTLWNTTLYLSKLLITPSQTYAIVQIFNSTISTPAAENVNEYNATLDPGNRTLVFQLETSTQPRPIYISTNITDFTYDLASDSKTLTITCTGSGQVPWNMTNMIIGLSSPTRYFYYKDGVYQATLFTNDIQLTSCSTHVFTVSAPASVVDRTGTILGLIGSFQILVGYIALIITVLALSIILIIFKTSDPQSAMKDLPFYVMILILVSVLIGVAIVVLEAFPF